MDIAQVLALALTGGVVVPLLQVLKRYMHIEGAPMFWIALFFSWGVAILVVIATGKMSPTEVLNNPGVLFGSGGIVITVAQAVYRSIKERMGLGDQS